MENPIKMDDMGGKPTIFGNIHIIEFENVNDHLTIYSLHTPNPSRQEPGEQVNTQKLKRPHAFMLLKSVEYIFE